MPAGVITRLLGKAAVEIGKRGYRKLTEETFLTKAIEETAGAFPHIEASQSLITWSKSEDFNALIEALKAGDRNLTDRTVINSFIKIGGFYMGSDEETHAVAKEVVTKFAENLEQGLYNAPGGIGVLANRGESQHTETVETIYQSQREVISHFTMEIASLKELLSCYSISAEQSSEFPALHQLEPPPRDFTGRSSELNELMAEFDKSGVTICLLQGMGGVGKTALALILAEQLTARYPDAQIYLDLKGLSPEPLSTADVMFRVIRAFQPQAKLPTNEEELAACYRSVLHGRRALLLFDNAADRWQVEPLVPPVGCALLITSRRNFHLPGMVTKRVDTLPPEDARKLLLTIAPRIDDLADTVAGLCGYLPLALRNSATLLAERVDISVADHVSRLTDAHQRLDPVAGSIGLSYEQLDHELQKLWRSLAVFPGLFDVGAVVSVWGIEKERAQDALSELVKYNLVEWHEVAGRYRLHDLMRLFADEQLSESEREQALGRHSQHYIMVLKAANHLFDKIAEHRWLGLALSDMEWHNILVGQSWAQSNTDKNNLAAILCSLYPDAGAHLLHLRVHPNECIRWREAALAAARRLNNRIEEACHLGNLGMDYAESGQTRRAIEVQEQALQISREIGDRSNEAHGLRNLGMCYVSLGEPNMAIEYFEQSLLAYREIGDHHGAGLALGNLGMVYAETGEFRRAINYYEEALPLVRASGDRRNEGGLLSSLGAAYAPQGETERAVELYQTALSISYEVGDLRGIANNLGRLGWILASVGDNERGFEFHQRQLSAARELGDLHNEADALYGLGIILSKYRDNQRAVECFEGALKIFRETGHRYSEARALGDLGNHYTRAEEFHTAIECYEQQLIIAREIRDRRGEALAIWNTAWALSRMGRYAEAIAKGEEALRRLEEIEDSVQVGKLRKQLDDWRKG